MATYIMAVQVGLRIDISLCSVLKAKQNTTQNAFYDAFHLCVDLSATSFLLLENCISLLNFPIFYPTSIRWNDEKKKTVTEQPLCKINKTISHVCPDGVFCWCAVSLFFRSTLSPPTRSDAILYHTGTRLMQLWTAPVLWCTLLLRCDGCLQVER